MISFLKKMLKQNGSLKATCFLMALMFVCVPVFVYGLIKFCSLNLKRIEMDYDFEETRSGRMLKKLRESIKERIESLTNSLSEKYENVNDLKSFIQSNIGNLKSDIVRSDDGVINCACCGEHIPDNDKIFGYMNGDIIHHSCEDAYKLKLEEKDV